MKRAIGFLFLLALAACSSASSVETTLPPSRDQPAVTTTTRPQALPTPTSVTTTTVADLVQQPLGGYLGVDRSAILAGFEIVTGSQSTVYDATGSLVSQSPFADVADIDARHNELNAEFEELLVVASDSDETCVVDGFDFFQRWVLCTTSGSDDNPVMKLASLDNEIRLVGSLPLPPAEFVGATRIGVWREIFVRPDGVILAQLLTECEARHAMIVRDGEARFLNGEGYWGEWPTGESIALGWDQQGRALVWHFSSECSEEEFVAGVYAYSEDGSQELLTATDGEARGIRSDQMTRGVSSIHPYLSDVQISTALTTDAALLDDFELAADYLTWTVGWGDLVSHDGLDGTDSWTYYFSSGDNNIEIRMEVAGWRLNGDMVPVVTYASTFTDTEEFFLSVAIDENESGEWLANVSVPDPATLGYPAGTTVKVKLQYESAAYEGEVLDSVTQMMLSDEPHAWGVLEIAYRDPEGLAVGWHSVTVPAGSFAAG